jgi:hypothetical protein
VPPVLGDLAEVGAVSEVEEDRPRGVHEFRDAGCAPAGVQGEVGGEGAGQVVLAGHRVADVGAGDESRDAARWLLVDEQLREQFPQSFGGWVLAAPERYLSLGLEQGPRAGKVALAVIGVKEGGRCPAADGGGQLPGQIDGIEHAIVDADARGGELMSRVAGQQDPSIDVPLGLARLKPVARQPGRFFQRKVRPEDAADAVSELGQGHRRIRVGAAGLVLGRLDEQSPGGEPPEREHAVVCPGETRLDPAEPGDVEVTVVQLGHRTRHGGLRQPVDLWIGDARERDPGPVAHLAVRAVAAHQVAGGRLVGPIRPAHSRRHGRVALADPDHIVSAANAGAEFVGVLAEQALEPRLGEVHHL